MACHKTDVLLRVVIHAPSLWDYVADVFVAFLDTGFLPGTHGVTIVDACADDVFEACF